jgi:hypothetical protein
MHAFGDLYLQRPSVKRANRARSTGDDMTARPRKVLSTVEGARTIRAKCQRTASVMAVWAALLTLWSAPVHADACDDLRRALAEAHDRQRLSGHERGEDERISQIHIAMGALGCNDPVDPLAGVAPDIREAVRRDLERLQRTDPQAYKERLKAMNIPGHTFNPTPSAVPPTANPTPSAIPPTDSVTATAPTTPEPSPDGSALPPADLPSPEPSPSPVSPSNRPVAPLPVFPLSPSPPRQSGDLPSDWCVIHRDVTVIPGQATKQNSVARCDQVAGLGPDWGVVQGNLTFPEANKIRDQLNGSDPPNVWCVMQRLAPGTSNFERTVIRCDNVAGAGPGWTPIATNLPLPEANKQAFGTPPAGGARLPGGRRGPVAPLPPPVIATGPSGGGAGTGPAPLGHPSPPAPLPPTTIPGPIASAPLPPTTLNAPPAAPGECPAGGTKHTCVYVSNYGIGGAMNVMNVCVPPQGYGSASCFTDVILPGANNVDSRNNCSPPKSYSDLQQRCKELHGNLQTSTPTGLKSAVLPVAPLPPVALGPSMPKHSKSHVNVVDPPGHVDPQGKKHVNIVTPADRGFRRGARHNDGPKGKRYVNIVNPSGGMHGNQRRNSGMSGHVGGRGVRVGMGGGRTSFRRH